MILKWILLLLLIKHIVISSKDNTCATQLKWNIQNLTQRKSKQICKCSNMGAEYFAQELKSCIRNKNQLQSGIFFQISYFFFMKGVLKLSCITIQILVRFFYESLVSSCCIYENWEFWEYLQLCRINFKELVYISF